MSVPARPARGGLDGWLLLLCVSRSVYTLIFMTYAATLPVLRGEWGMSATAAGSVATGFQLGYAISLLVFSWLSDRAGRRRVLFAMALSNTLCSFVFG